MGNRINFLDIPYERGQTHPGLKYSSEYFKRYLDQSSLYTSLDFKFKKGHHEPDHWSYKKVYSELDLNNFKLEFYQSAFEQLNTIYAECKPMVNWGGDHSIAIATVTAFLNYFPEGYVIWIDAHADINIPASSLTGNLHGTPASFLLNIDNIGQRQIPWTKHFLSPQKLIYIGLRDLDPFEEDLIYCLGVKVYSMKSVSELGLSYIMDEVKAYVNEAPVHVTFDIDSIDPMYAPCTGVPVPGGLDRNEILYIARQLSTAQVKSLDIVEINPLLGSKEDLEKTFSLALEFLTELYVTEKRSFHERSYTANSV